MANIPNDTQVSNSFSSYTSLTIVWGQRLLEANFITNKIQEWQVYTNIKVLILALMTYSRVVA